MIRSGKGHGLSVRWALALLAGTALAGCGAMPKLPGTAQATRGDSAADAAMVERDVEAPEVFAAEDDALWDGRPSLGGVWLAAPGVTSPERIVIRNRDNGKVVIGALFKREAANPGPALQLSSDAAKALGIAAGRPTAISAVALREREVPAVELPAIADGDDPTAAPMADIVATSLDAPPADGPDASFETRIAAAVDAPSQAPAASLAKPFVQVGIFSVQANAGNTAEAFRQAGLTPDVRQGTSSGKPFWRVLIGPAATNAEREATLQRAVDLGFKDAYPVGG
ncbi:SPOR domain-containing protein [Jannaschia sp. LMIT008]|uniref:SPOR domain-containing protein n=1 Tax=Jannaschia maritima TaxID=3032585 RepID=UPI00281283D2|nr:SPOR domain-containing protein [Jannaschia sp. LMIT008]